MGLPQDYRERLAHIDEETEGVERLYHAVSAAGGHGRGDGDIFVAGMVQRVLGLAAGYAVHVRLRQYGNAMCLTRVLLDCCMRMQAAFLVDDLKELLAWLESGAPLYELEDRSGQQFGDRYLVRLLKGRRGWAEDLYDTTSGYIHYSRNHTRALKAMPNLREGEGLRPIPVAAEEENIGEEAWVASMEAFQECVQLFRELLQEWLDSGRAARREG